DGLFRRANGYRLLRVLGLGGVVGLGFFRFLGLGRLSLGRLSVVGGFVVTLAATASTLTFLLLQRTRRWRWQLSDERQVEGEDAEQADRGRRAVDPEQPSADAVEAEPDFADRCADDQHRADHVQHD